MKDRPLVSVVVPTRGRPGTAARCVRSVLDSDYPRIEVIVVDDASSQQDFLELSRATPRARILRNETRVLLAATRNRGIGESKGEFIFLVDDDNVVDKAAIRELVDAAELSGAGVVSPVIYYYSEPDTVWYAGAWMSPASGMAVFPHRGNKGVAFAGPHKTSLFHDAFMVRRSCFEEVGAFDSDDFPIYLSEADFAERLVRKGISAVVVPAAKVWHDIPVIRGGSNMLRNMHMTEPSRAYYVARNRIVFVKRYRSPGQKVVFLAFFVPVIGMLHLISILGSSNKSRVSFFRYYLGGIVAGLRA